jgi:Flp pilus assembly protein TadB
MSKERARRRAEREREAAIRAAARAEEQARRERKAARRHALTRRLPGSRPARPIGVLAQRRRNQTTFVVCLLVVLNVLLWTVSDFWAVRLGGLVLSVLAGPVLYTLLFRRR